MSSDMTPTYPRDIATDKNIKNKYLEPIKNSENLHFKELSDVYLLSAVIGFNNKHRVKTSSDTKLKRFDTLSDKQRLIMNVIAYKDTGAFDILEPQNGREFCKLIEEYANGGAELLHSMVFEKVGSSKIVLDKLLLDTIKAKIKK